MTGAEFKASFFLFGMAVLMPAVLLIVIRSHLEEEPDDDILSDVWWGGFVKLALCVSGLFIAFLIKSWSDADDISWIFGLTAGLTYFATLHVLLVLFLVKLGQIVVRPTQPRVPLSIYCVCFVAAYFFQNYLVEKGKSPVDGAVSAKLISTAPRSILQPAAKPRAEISQTESKAPPPSAPLPAVKRQGDWVPSYEEAVAIVEQEFPQLNPDSPEYDSGVVEKVKRRMDAYQAQHMTPIAALVVAVNEVIRSNGTSEPREKRIQRFSSMKSEVPDDGPYSPDASDETESCRFKPVMTNTDLLACGIQPPQ